MPELGNDNGRVPFTVRRLDHDDEGDLAVRIDALVGALKEKFGMADDDAREVATTVAIAFRDTDEVNDETLDSEMRSLFYTLEAKKLLTFRREEYTWENGERRRAFYWRVRDEEIERMARLPHATAEPSVYDELPASVWSRQAS